MKHPDNVWFANWRLRGRWELDEPAATGLQAKQQSVNGRVEGKRLSCLQSRSFLLLYRFRCDSVSIQNEKPGSWFRLTLLHRRKPAWIN